jgi:DNA polymerase phi
MKKHTLHFKLRVIDLLEAFSQSQPQSPFILFLIENILDLILNSGEKELKDRLTNALRKILSRKEHPSSLEVDSKKAEEMLRRVHDLSCRIIDSSFSTLCSLASVFLVKVLSGTKQIESPSAKKQKISSHSSISSDTLVVSQIYLDSFNNFITKSKSKLKPSLFLELFNRYPQYGWEIFPQMVDLLGGEKIKSYNLVQGYNIMATLVKLNKEVIILANFYKLDQ